MNLAALRPARDSRNFPKNILRLQCPRRLVTQLEDIILSSFICPFSVPNYNGKPPPVRVRPSVVIMPGVGEEGLWYYYANSRGVTVCGGVLAQLRLAASAVRDHGGGDYDDDDDGDYTEQAKERGKN